MKKSENRSLIGRILADLGYVKMERVDDALEMQRGWPVLKLGEILVTTGALTQEQLEQGLRVQKIEKGD